MDNKRILILSANTGEGHNSAAKAVAEALESRGCECVIHDGLAFLPAPVNRLLCRGHIFVYRCLPMLFGLGYRLGEILCAKPRPAKKHIHLSRSGKKLLDFIRNGSFDAVLCTHVFPARILSGIRRELPLPCCFLATDYTCSPGVNRLDMDAWLIPHPRLAGEFSRRGIAEEKLFPTGIPVLREFEPVGDKSALRRRLGLPENKRIVIISCGSMGAGNMKRLALSLRNSITENALAVTLCGSNRALAESLGKFQNDKLIALGFVDRLSDYMEAADLCIIKPGGLSSTEAMRKRAPILFFNTVPGLETRNLHFLCGIGCASAAQNLKSLVESAVQALKDDKFAYRQLQNTEYEFPNDAAERICDFLLGGCRYD